MTAYEPEAWSDLFVMVGGAAAALAGLLFVAVSINLEEVLENKALPATAARSLTVLLSLVVLSVLVLVPGQPPHWLGVEVTVLGAVILVSSVVSVIGGHIVPGLPWRWSIASLGIALASTLPMLVLGVSLLVERGGGLAWAVVEVVLGIAAATYNGWIILIEIRR